MVQNDCLEVNLKINPAMNASQKALQFTKIHYEKQHLLTLFKTIFNDWGWGRDLASPLHMYFHLITATILFLSLYDAITANEIVLMKTHKLQLNALIIA